MTSQSGLLSAYVLDGKGAGQEVSWDGIRSWQPSSGTLWIHLDRSDPESSRWLREDSGLDALTCEALLAEETRPRCVASGDGLIVILRGVNLHPEADPEDMVSIRMWVEQNRVISVRTRRLMAVQDARDTLARNTGPKDASGLLVRIASRLVDRMGPVIEALDEHVDDLEEEILTAQSYELRTKLSALRRQAIALRRYISPQREVMTRLQTEQVAWLTALDRSRLREVADRVTRYVEDLDSARERASVTQEELGGRLAEQMNKTMYVLSIVAAVFLPLGLLTGLLGINVGGIPGVESPWAFAIVCLILVGVAVVQIIVFRKMKWL
jgi:zinc transporter